MKVIDKILNEWSYRCHDGIVDLDNPNKVKILFEILKEYSLVITENKKIEYSTTLKVLELNKEREGRLRGETVTEFIIKKIPFTLVNGENKILDFIDDKIQNIFINKEFNKLSDEQFSSIHTSLVPSIREVLTVQGAIASRTTAGGTAPSEVKKQIATALKKSLHQRTEIANKSNAFSEMMSS